VLADVLCQLAGVHNFYGLTVGKPFAVNFRQIVFVLSQLIKNLRHTLKMFSLGFAAWLRQEWLIING
jgi:hypothetical protein